MNLLLKKISNLYVYIASVIFDNLIKLKKQKIVPKTLLVVKTDAIGDYILFRNFLQVLRESQKFSDYKITLLGNSLWRELAEKLDNKFVDSFIWLDKNKFHNDLKYRYDILKKVYLHGFEVSLSPLYSREILFSDMIVKASNSPERTGSEGALEKHAKWKRTLFTDNVFTSRIEASGNNLFEFERNKEFFENYFREKIDLKAPHIDTSCIEMQRFSDNKYIVLFPGAGDKFRQWDVNNFVEVSKYILENYNYDIAISGSPRENQIADDIRLKLNSNRVYNLIGRSPLTQLAKLLSESELLISNETSAVHFAAAVNSPVICISNGSYLGRFHPYPENVFNKAYYIYPPEILNDRSLHLSASEDNKFRYHSHLSVNEIKPETVIARIKEILK